jgi:hypothetical protein
LSLHVPSSCKITQALFGIVEVLLKKKGWKGSYKKEKNTKLDNQGTAETLTNHWQQLIEINQHINNLGCMSN